MHGPHWLSRVHSEHTNKYNLCIGHGWQRIVYARSLRGHGEKRSYSQRHPSRDTLRIKPEADPRYDDQHAARDVVLDQVVGKLSLEHEVHLQAAIRTCTATKNSSLPLSGSIYFRGVP